MVCGRVTAEWYWPGKGWSAETSAVTNVWAPVNVTIRETKTRSLANDIIVIIVDLKNAINTLYAQSRHSTTTVKRIDETCLIKVRRIAFRFTERSAEWVWLCKHSSHSPTVSKRLCHIIKGFSMPGSPIILVFLYQTSAAFRRDHPQHRR